MVTCPKCENEMDVSDLDGDGQCSNCGNKYTWEEDDDGNLNRFSTRFYPIWDEN